MNGLRSLDLKSGGLGEGGQASSLTVLERGEGERGMAWPRAGRAARRQRPRQLTREQP